MKATFSRVPSSRRIPLHDHSDLNSGGKLRISTAIQGGLPAIVGSTPPTDPPPDVAEFEVEHLDDIGDVTAPDPADGAPLAFDELLGWRPSDALILTQPGSGSASVGTPVSIANNTHHLGFPGVARLPDGDLFVTWRDGTDHVGTPDGKTRGAVGGTLATLGTAFDIYDHASLDVRGTEVSVIGSTVFVTSGLYDDPDHVNGVVSYADTSSDLADAASWTAADVNTGFTDVRVVQVQRVIELEAGVLGLACYGNDTGSSTVRIARLLESHDNGQTWGTRANITTTSGNWGEPQVVRLPDGRLRCFLRENTDKEAWRTDSPDNGLTWDTEVLAFTDSAGKPTVELLDSGAMLHVGRPDPTGDTQYRVSWDLGETWSSATVLDTAGTDNEYASILSDGTVVYSVKSSDTNADIKGVIVTVTRDLATVEFPERTAPGTPPSGTVAVYAKTDGLMYSKDDAGTETGMFAGSPTGAAGGDLSGTYPNPSVVDDSHSHTAATLPASSGGGIGPILITDTPAGSPLVFADLLQNEAGDDLLYADV